MSVSGIRLRALDDNLLPVFTVEATAGTKILNTLDSLSQVSGALVISGGLGIEKNVYIGGTVNSTSISSGTLFVASMTSGSLNITDLFTNRATFTNLFSPSATLGSLNVSTSMNATNATFGNLVSAVATIGTISITGAVSVPSATISSLFSGTCSTGSLISVNMTSASALITNFQATNLTSGNIISSTLNTPSATITNLTTTNFTVPNISITNASVSNMIVLSASTFGSLLSTNLVAASTTFSNLLNTLSLTTGNLLVTTVGNFSTASFGNIFSNSSTLASLIATTITSSTLQVTGFINSVNGTIGALISTNASMTSLICSTGASIANLTSTNATSTNATITNLVTTTTTVTNLQVPGAISSGNIRVISGADIRIGFNSGNSQLALWNSSNNSCFEMGVLASNSTMMKNVVSGGIIHLNTITGSVRFGSGTSTNGSTITISPPSTGDTVGSTGIVSVIGSLVVNSVTIFPNSGDIRKELTFQAANNQLTPSNITNLRFDETTTRSFLCYLSSSIIATSNLYAQFELRGLQMNTGNWMISSEHVGDVTGLEFTIISSGGFGQVQYTSNLDAGFVSNKMNFTAVTTGI